MSVSRYGGDFFHRLCASLSVLCASVALLLCSLCATLSLYHSITLSHYSTALCLLQ